MMRGENPLLAIGYKYNSWTVLSFVATAGVGSTMLGITYLSKYPDQLSNVSIRPVYLPLLVSKFFGSVYEVESYNKSRQLDIAPENFWVKKCDWIWLCTTVAMGMKITNCWKLFRYGVKRATKTSLLASENFRNESLLIASIIFSKHTQGLQKRTYLPLMKLITKALCIPL